MLLKRSTYFDPNIPRDAEYKRRFLSALGVPDDYVRIKIDDLPNLEKVTEGEFWNSASSFRAEAWCDISKVDGKWRTILVYFDDSGTLKNGGYAVAVSRDYPPEPPIYYKWVACLHDFKYSRLGNCWHKYTCSKCNESYEVDSSG